MTIVFIFIFLDLLILISVTAITGSRYTVITIADKEHPGEHTSVRQTKINAIYSLCAIIIVNACPFRKVATL